MGCLLHSCADPCAHLVPVAGVAVDAVRRLKPLDVRHEFTSEIRIRPVIPGCQDHSFRSVHLQVGSVIALRNDRRHRAALFADELHCGRRVMHLRSQLLGLVGYDLGDSLHLIASQKHNAAGVREVPRIRVHGVCTGIVQDGLAILMSRAEGDHAVDHFSAELRPAVDQLPVAPVLAFSRPAVQFLLDIPVVPLVFLQGCPIGADAHAVRYAGCLFLEYDHIGPRFSSRVGGIAP